MRRIRTTAAAGFTRSRRARPAPRSAATATVSSTRRRSAGSRTRRRSSSSTRATTSAPASPIRWKSPRSPARWRARSASTRTWPRRSRSATISATRRSATPASGRSTAASHAYGGFDHNAQTLRVVTALERRYADFDGLNLTWETLEGLVKHNGPLTDRAGTCDRPLRRARRAARDRRLSADAGPRTVELRERRGAGRRDLATTSPTTPTTSTTACAPSCSRSKILREVPLVRDILADIGAADERSRPRPGRA